MIEPESIWWSYAQVINWVFTRNLRLVNLMVDQQHPKTKRYALEELRLPDKSPLLSKEGEIEIRARLLGESDQSELSHIDILAMNCRPGGEYDGHAEAVWAINQAVQTGKLECWARPAGGGKRELVGVAEWADLTITEEVGPVAVLQSGAPIWQELRFKSERVIELWPPERAGTDKHDETLEGVPNSGAAESDAIDGDTPGSLDGKAVSPQESSAGKGKQPDKPDKRKPLKADTDNKYARRVEEYRADKDRPPTWEEDEQWRKGHAVGRGRLRELRKTNLTDEEKKGGAPPNS